MPYPNKGESKDHYIPRCMSHPEMNAKFPDQKQREAVCFSYWRERGDVSEKIKKVIIDKKGEN